MQNVSFRVGACKGMLEHAARGQQQLFLVRARANTVSGTNIVVSLKHKWKTRRLDTVWQ